jgi:hypothetical protein
MTGTPAYQGAGQPPPSGGSWFGFWNWGGWRCGNTPAYHGEHGGHGGHGSGSVLVRAGTMTEAEAATLAFAIDEAPALVAQATTVCSSDVTAYRAAPIAIVIPRQT